MRRLVLIVIMVLLPLQWSWATVASVCAHETEVATPHLGHHAHEHHGPGAQPEPEQLDAKTVGDHPDCSVCHGIGTPFVTSDTAVTFYWDGRSRFAPYQAVIPDRSTETLLRPPPDLVS